MITIQDKLARFAIPGYIRAVENLPGTGTSRIEKGELKSTGVTPDTFDEETLLWHRHARVLNLKAARSSSPLLHVGDGRMSPMHTLSIIAVHFILFGKKMTKKRGMTSS